MTEAPIRHNGGHLDPAAYPAASSHESTTGAGVGQYLKSGQIARREPAAALAPPPSNPMAVARCLVAERFTTGSTVVVLSWRGGFYRWDGRCWGECDEAAVRAAAYRFLEHAEYEEMVRGERVRLPWEPSRHKIANVLEALRVVTRVSETVESPAWLTGQGPDARQLVVTQNGILHVPSRELLPHDARLFVTHAVPFAFDPAAPKPERWLTFLHELWGGDTASIALAQEMAGYLVSGDTSIQKIMLAVGPTRAGKGVFANVLSALVGRHNVGAPTLATLTTNFGLQDLIGKTLAVVSDARLSSKANVAALAERLLSVSGEDAITIDRKYRVPWTGRLAVRFLLLTNELPRFTDASGALAKRFVVLVFRLSFYGREDPTLLLQILPELPGILNWALDGLDRLREQGHFTAPASSRDAIRELEDLASPMGAFLRDRAVLGPELRVTVDDAWADWKGWCEEQSQPHGSKQTFGRDLRAAVPGLRVAQPRGDGPRHREYLGVGLGANNAPDRVPRVPDRGDAGGGTHGTRSDPSFPRPDNADEPGFEDDYPASTFDGADKPPATDPPAQAGR